MGHLGIGGKLWLAVGTLVVALLGSVGFSGWRAGQQQQLAEADLRANDAKLKIAHQWAAVGDVTMARAAAIYLSGDEHLVKAFKAPIAEGMAEIVKLRKALDNVTLTEQDRRQIETISQHREAVLALSARLKTLREAGQMDEARALVEQQYLPAARQYTDSLQRFAQLQDEAAVAVRSRIADGRRSTVQIAAVFVVSVVVLALLGARVLIRSIKQPLDDAIGIASRIAEGDLTARIEVSRRDEFGQLMQALKTMSASLAALVTDVRHSADGIGTASAEIATGNQDLSGRTEQAASSLQQTASSMEQLTGTVQHTAHSAQEANTLAGTASQAAQRGGEVVGQVVSTMNEIADSSKKIADIIGVIDGIAFQTNILALNAAVEAARAGEQGRGFAVVASEVRTLAQRSAQAAREIKSLIAASTDRVDSGAALVGQAGQAMNDIVVAIQRVTDMMQDISASAAEQSDGIVQVNQAVNHLDQMTQQNAALVEQSAAAAESLREQTRRLSSAVDAFRVTS